MPDLEKVIKALELCKEDGNYCYGKQCPYEKNFPRCVKGLLADALSLLKEQQKLIDGIMRRRANNGEFD